MGVTKPATYKIAFDNFKKKPLPLGDKSWHKQRDWQIPQEGSGTAFVATPSTGDINKDNWDEGLQSEFQYQAVQLKSGFSKIWILNLNHYELWH